MLALNFFNASLWHPWVRYFIVSYWYFIWPWCNWKLQGVLIPAPLLLAARWVNWQWNTFVKALWSYGNLLYKSDTSNKYFLISVTSRPMEDESSRKEAFSPPLYPRRSTSQSKERTEKAKYQPRQGTQQIQRKRCILNKTSEEKLKGYSQMFGGILFTRC